MEGQSELGSHIPGGVYLCQVSHKVSCGACCGLYNVADPSFEALFEMLAVRRKLFAQTERSLDAILTFKNDVEKRESQQRPYTAFHHCPFIGLIGRRSSRVGCLLHPSAAGNQGVDYRGLSYYGAMACRTYFCPACHRLPANIKRIVQRISISWYWYGMTITEATLLQVIFGEIEQRLQRPIDWIDIRQNSACRKAVSEILMLKSRWPFRSSADNGLCHYFFSSPVLPRPMVDYAIVGKKTSKYDILFRELVSSFDSPADLEEAERYLDGLFDRIVGTINRETNLNSVTGGFPGPG